MSGNKENNAELIKPILSDKGITETKIEQWSLIEYHTIPRRIEHEQDLMLSSSEFNQTGVTKIVLKDLKIQEERNFTLERKIEEIGNKYSDLDKEKAVLQNEKENTEEKLSLSRKENRRFAPISTLAGILATLSIPVFTSNLADSTKYPVGIIVILVALVLVYIVFSKSE